MIKGIDFPGVTCGCICTDGNGGFLLSLRSPNCRDEQNTWEFGGGSLEFGETLEEHVRREMREELNLRLDSLKMLDVKTVLRQNGDKQSHWILFVWTGVVTNPNDIKVLDSDVVDFKWFTKDTLPTNLHSTVPYMLEVGIKNGVL
jgi:8-oxo-dGTP pyrophosphatase MutT (NUDIX family)